MGTRGRNAVVGALACLIASVGAAPAGATSSAQGIRIFGPDRIGTAIAVSQVSFPQGGAKAVVLARADGFADSLAGAPLAVAHQAPLLLTGTDALDPRVETELRRVLAAGQTVYLLGLQAALSDAVANTVTSDGYTVTRLGGAERYATALAIANTLGTPQTILLATGNSIGDALPAGAAAAAIGGVVLLTDDAVMPGETKKYLTDHSSIKVDALGGPAAAADPAATSIIGSDRYQTSVKVAQTFFTGPTTVGFANGISFPDALAGGPAVGMQHGPLLLVAPNVLPDVVRDYVHSINSTVTLGEVYGGPASIPDGVLAAIDSALQGN